MISRRFFFAWTLRFTRGMTIPRSGSLRRRSRAEDAADDLLLGTDRDHARDAPLAAAGLLHQEVVPGGLAAKDLPRRRDAEALGRSPVRLHLRHRSTLIPFLRPRPPVDAAWCALPPARAQTRPARRPGALPLPDGRARHLWPPSGLPASWWAPRPWSCCARPASGRSLR